MPVTVQSKKRDAASSAVAEAEALAAIARQRAALGLKRTKRGKKKGESKTSKITSQANAAVSFLLGR